MYSTTDRVSFNEVSRLAMTIRLLHKNTHPKPILVLIGTKVDLEPQRIVSELEGKKLAESLNARFYEVSSRDDYNEVARIFRESANVCRLNMVKVRSYFNNMVKINYYQNLKFDQKFKFGKKI